MITWAPSQEWAHSGCATKIAKFFGFFAYAVYFVHNHPIQPKLPDPVNDNIPLSSTVRLDKYDGVVIYLLSEHRRKFGSDLIDASAKAEINKSLARLMTETGISIRPKWIADARVGAEMAYEKAHKLFSATNNLLKRFEFDLIPETAFVVLSK